MEFYGCHSYFVNDVYVGMSVVEALEEELVKAENLANAWRMVAESLMGVDSSA
jgi:hypothetical protein